VVFAKLGRIAPRGRGVVSDEYLFVVAREGGRSRIAETLIMKSKSRGVLDRPVKPDDDGSLRRREARKQPSLFANEKTGLLRCARNDVHCFCIATKLQK
jgi:hypothetical protein